jgi:hypothetical protein
MLPGRAAQIGLWLLPAYGFLLGLNTLTHQPPVAAIRLPRTAELAAPLRTDGR